MLPSLKINFFCPFLVFLLFVIVNRTFEARTRVKLELSNAQLHVARAGPSIVAIIGEQHVRILLRSIHFLVRFAYFSAPAIQCVCE